MVFFGTGAYGLAALEALAASRHSVLSVITSPDKPRGRNLQVEASPIKETALRLGLSVQAYEKGRSDETLSRLRALAPDFFVVVSFGFLLSKEFLSVPRIAPLNIHPSLLPRHRGASPMPWTLLEGDARTGVTVIRMNERMDAGDIAAQAEIPVEPDDDLPSLEKKLSALGARLLVETLDRWEAGAVKPQPQDESRATYTKKFAKEDGRLDFSLPADRLSRRVRALQGWPGAYATIRGKRLLIRSATAVSGEGSPGTVLSSGADGIQVAAGQGALSLRAVQLEGKKLMPAADFLRGFPIGPGDRFE